MNWLKQSTAVTVKIGPFVDDTDGKTAETGLTTELSTSGGTSDGRFIATLCPQVIECGPPHEGLHQIDEHIAIADIEPLKNIYRRTLENLHAQALATQA